MKRESSSKRHRVWLACLGAGVCLAGGAALRAAQQDPGTGGLVAGTDAAAPSATPSASPVAASAMRVAIDPETGLLGLPSAEASKALELPQAETPLPPIQVGADGTMRLRVQGHFRHFAVAELGRDGRVQMQCTQDCRAAKDAVCGHEVPPVTPAAAGSAPTAPQPAEVK